MKKILTGSDICLDSITGRYPFSMEADRLLEAVEEGKLIGIVSAESFSNMYYVIRKFSSHQKAITLLNHLRKIVKTGTITPDIVQLALSSGWRDIEDALQHFCAVHEGCDAIITRNKADYRKSHIPIYSPAEALVRI